MAKLDELLGKYLPEWPDGAEYLWQACGGYVYNQQGDKVFYMKEIASDVLGRGIVTKNQYLAARDRIATNMQATKEAREIAHGEGQRFCNSEHMIAAIESEALPKHDRKLWKRAALAAFAGYCARPGMDAECAAEEAMFAADAFMNAMEKHLNSN